MLRITNTTKAEAKCDVCGSDIQTHVFPAAHESQVQPVGMTNYGRLSVDIRFPDGRCCMRSVELCAACTTKAMYAVGLKPEA
jgi:hypothetical protein